MNAPTGHAGSGHSQVRLRHRIVTGRPKHGASTSRPRAGRGCGRRPRTPGQPITPGGDSTVTTSPSRRDASGHARRRPRAGRAGRPAGRTGRSSRHATRRFRHEGAAQHAVGSDIVEVFRSGSLVATDPGRPRPLSPVNLTTACRPLPPQVRRAALVGRGKRRDRRNGPRDTRPAARAGAPRRPLAPAARRHDARRRRLRGIRPGASPQRAAGRDRRRSSTAHEGRELTGSRPSRSLAGRELRVRSRVGQIGGGRLVQERDHGAVDVDADGAVRSRSAGGRVDPGEQIRAPGREVEDLDLVGLPLVQSLLDRLVGPGAELRVPQRAVGLGVPGVAERREVAEDVEQVTAATQRIDQCGVRGGGVLGRVAVENQVTEALRVRTRGSSFRRRDGRGWFLDGRVLGSTPPLRHRLASYVTAWRGVWLHGPRLWKYARASGSSVNSSRPPTFSCSSCRRVGGCGEEELAARVDMVDAPVLERVVELTVTRLVTRTLSHCGDLRQIQVIVCKQTPQVEAQGARVGHAHNPSVVGSSPTPPHPLSWENVRTADVMI